MPGVGRRVRGEGRASPVLRPPLSCSDRAIPSGLDSGPRSLPDPPALTRPSPGPRAPCVLRGFHEEPQQGRQCGGFPG